MTTEPFARLGAHETELGAAADGTHQAQTSRRIHWLVEHNLERIAVLQDEWTVLYRDAADGRYWELSYPHSEQHGGGLPQLIVVSLEDARRKYGQLIADEASDFTVQP